jgi:large subunit ribosomal protein L24
MRKIKKGDEVIVLKGKSKGVRGRVLVVADEGKRVVVEGAGLIKKHMKPNPQKNQQGGIIEREAPISVANVAIYNPVTKKADRVGIKTLSDGKRVRYFKSTGELVESV